MDQMSKTILLVEDNPDDVVLTLRAFNRNNMLNPIDVARDGIEALDFLFARGAYADRTGKPLPALVILDLKLPRLDGLGVLQSSAVENSNVDLTAELVNMITAQRVYQANAQTIKTQDSVLQTLVNLR